MCKAVAPTRLQTGRAKSLVFALRTIFCVTLNKRSKVQDEVRQTASIERVNWLTRSHACKSNEHVSNSKGQLHCPCQWGRSLWTGRLLSLPLPSFPSKIIIGNQTDSGASPRTQVTRENMAGKTQRYRGQLADWEKGWRSTTRVFWELWAESSLSLEMPKPQSHL